jgi:hypothetical protein
MRVSGDGLIFPDGSIQSSAAYSKEQLNAQLWKNVTAERTWGQNFINDTGLPIQVSCFFDSSNGVNLGAYGIVNGVQVGNIFVASDSPTISLGFSFIVPVGATYSVTMAGASAADWLELRS